MSNNYLITNLINIKDENLNFSDGIYHKVIKGITHTILEAKLEYSNQVKRHILSSLTKKSSLKDIGSENYVSTTTIARFIAKFDNEFNVDFSYLPKHLSNDEFKSTIDSKGAMSFIYLNSDNHKVIDIVENRQLYFLKKYFLCYPRYVRDKVKTVCIDMYSPYISLIKGLFVNAEIIIDRFHIVKLFTNSFNHTRIDTMKGYSTSNIKYKRLKKYWRHFLKPYKLLDPIHFLKSVHFPAGLVSDEDVVDVSLNIDKTSINTCFYYLNFIKNSFTYDYSNGPIEGINNFIKVLKRIAFGYRSFANFRTTIFITRTFL